MNDQTQKAIDKIKKCLALASSDNPHESAAAMRQAKALMEKFNISAADVSAADIGESKTKSTTMARDKPAQWEANLAAMIGSAFGCKLLISRLCSEIGRPLNTGEYVYIGLKHQAEVASYTATILIRNCKKARSAFIEQLPTQLSKPKKTKAGDAFAVGWTTEIRKKVSEFANPKSVEDAIEKHLNKSVTSSEDAPTRKSISNRPSTLEILAATKGSKEAQNEQLHRPMSTTQATMIGFENGAAA
jgi:hypothetical protein